MITLERKGRWIYFTSEVPEKLHRVIDKRLSYVKKGAHFMRNPAFGVVHLFNVKLKRFPHGLLNSVIPILESWDKQNGESFIIVNTEENIKFNKTYNSKGLRSYQIEAIERLRIEGGGQIVLPTSAGKTKVAISFINLIKQPCETLIVVPNKELKKQWIDAISEERVYPDTVETYQYLNRHPQLLETYGLVIFDEVHHAAAKTIYNVAMRCDNAIMVGLTATPERSDGEDMKVTAAIGPIVYRVPIKDLTEQGYLVPARIHVIDLEPYKAGPMEEYRDIYKNAIVKNNNRNLKIFKIAKEKFGDGPVLILVDSVEHGDRLSDLFEFVGLNYIFVHGKSKDREKIFEDIKNNKYDIIIASKIYNEGINLKNLRTLIMAGGGKSSVKILQQIGRMLRLDEGKKIVDIYDFYDRARSLTQHSKARFDIYNKNGFEVVYK